MTSTATLQEVKDLATGMTLKHAFLGMPRGGAKAAIVASQSLATSEKERLVKNFGENIAPLLTSRRYLSGPDMGTDSNLIETMSRHVGLKTARRSTGAPNSAYFTSLSVLVAIETSLAIKGLPFERAAFAIEGFGGVGRALASHIGKRGGRVVAVSTREGAVYDSSGLDLESIQDLTRRYGDGWLSKYKGATHLPKEQLLELAVDVLAPCAGSYAITTKNMREIRAKIVCAGANNPVTMDADRYLFSQGILYLPDFATNCGGILGNAMEFAGITEEDFMEVLRDSIAKKYQDLWRIACARNIPPREVAIGIGEENLRRLHLENNVHRGRSHLRSILVDLYRHGLVPALLVRSYARRYFRKMLMRDTHLYKSRMDAIR
jgi:glutamate dehydrogenase/leucine dehydrogenase